MESEVKTRRRLKHPWLTALAGLLILVFGSIAVLVGLLKSQSGSDFILGKARTYLSQNMHTDFIYSEGRLDPFSGFHFKDLKITRNDAQMSASITIGELDLAYNLSLLRRRFEILNFNLAHAFIQVHRQAGPPLPEKPEPTPVASAESPLAKLERFILDPPVEVVMDHVTIEDLNVDADLDAMGGRKKVTLQKLNLHLQMEMVQERLAASGDLAMAPRNLVVNDVFGEVPGVVSGSVPGQPHAPTSAARSHLQAYFSAGGQWNLDIHREGKGWLYRFETSQLKTALEDVEILGDNAPVSRATQVAGTAAAKSAVDFVIAHPTSSLKMAKASFDLESKALLHSEKLFKLDRNSIETMAVQLTGSTSKIASESRAAEGASPAVTEIGPQKIDFHTLLAKDLEFEFVLDAAQLRKAPSLSGPVALFVQAKGSLPRTLDRVDLHSQVRLAGARLVQSELAVNLDHDAVKFKGQGDLTVERAHVRVIPALQKFQSGLALRFEIEGQRDKDGKIETKFATDIPNLVMAPLPRASKLNIAGHASWEAAEKKALFDGDVLFENPIYGGWKISPHVKADLLHAPMVNGETDVTQTIAPAPTGPPLILHQPMHAKYDVNLDPKTGHADFEVDLPSAEVPGKAHLDGLQATVKITSPDLKAAQDLKLDFEMKQAGMKLAPALASQLPPQTAPFKDLHASAKVSIVNKSRFVLDSMKLSLNGEEIAVETQASGEIKDKTLQAKTVVSVDMRDNFPDFNGQRLRGRVRIPVTINVLHGQQISLEGAMELSDVSWKKGDLSASGINGKLPFSEKLRWDGQHVRFENLVTQNPFERVEFDRVRPLLQSTEQLRIQKIGWFEKTYGPFIGFFSLDQNMIFAHQFDMDLVSGRLYGEMFVDAYPSSLQFGLLARMTGLDLGEILPKQFLNRVPSGDKKISGRSGFVINLNRSTMDGRIDVTEIGGSQLITAINIVDPKFEDEKMNKMRSLLQVGYPTSVELAFAEGYMNMDVGLSILGVGSHQSVHAIRISGLLAKSTLGFLKTAEKGPLK